MAGKRAAVAGDVAATAGSGLPDAAGGGTWTAGTPSVTTASRARIAGRPVALAAECTFAFLGKAKGDPASPVTDRSTVKLDPPPTLLRAGAPILRDGDTAQDRFGNTLAVTATGALASG